MVDKGKMEVTPEAQILMDKIEDYFGAYGNLNLKGYVLGYLMARHKPERYNGIFNALRLYHPVKFGAPCIATIENSLKLAFNNSEAEVFPKRGKRKKPEYLTIVKENKPDDFLTKELFRKIGAKELAKAKLMGADDEETRS